MNRNKSSQIHDFKGIGYSKIGHFKEVRTKIKELEKRVQEEKPEEIIIATNSNTDGETTALYLIKLLKPYGVRLTRPARGIPMGSNLEYMDQMTLACALEKREEIG